MGIKAWFGRQFGAKSYTVLLQVGEDGFMKSTAYTGGDLETLYTQTIWTYICACRISHDLAGLPAVVQVRDKRSGEWATDTGHELNALLRSPYGPGTGKPRWHWQQMIATGALRQEMCGNQFFRVVSSGQRLLALGLVMDTVTGILNENAIPTRYKIGTSGDEVPAEKLVNVMHANPGSWWDGISPVVAAQQAIHVDYSVSQRLRYDLETRVAPGVIFKVKALFSMQKAQRDDAETWLAEQFGMASKAGKSMVIGDNVEVQAPPMRELGDLPAHHDAARDAIISAFDVSPPVVGVLRDVKYQTWEQALRAQWALCIEPRARNIYSTINAQAVNPICGEDVRLWYDPIQSPLGLASVRDRADAAKSYFAFGYPANAINRHFSLGMPYYDELERPNMPLAVAGHSGDKPEEPTTEQTDDDPEDGGDEGEE